MARYRLSGPATADIARILRKNEAQHGPDARVRYRRLLATAMRRIAADPAGPSTSGRSDVLVGIRSFHIRHSRQESREAPVHDPVHVIFHRAVEPGLVEILRVLPCPLFAWPAFLKPRVGSKGLEPIVCGASGTHCAAWQSD